MPDVDSNILSTCQTIYTEALPILYQRNTFVFFDPYEIIQFKDAYLPCLGKSIPGVFSADKICLFHALRLSCHYLHTTWPYRFSS